MSKSSIEWTESTWNPITGCSKVSAGCKNCYAERMAIRQAHMECARLPHNANALKYLPIVSFEDGGWSGGTNFVESALSIPLKRKKATTYFVGSMGDTFHPTVPFEWLDKVFAVAALCPQHKFLFLTKHPERMAEYCCKQRPQIYFAARKMMTKESQKQLFDGFPLPNVLLGTTAENQEMADKRIPELLKCPAAKRFVSIEPMLGQVDIIPYIGGNAYKCKCEKAWHHTENNRLTPHGSKMFCLYCETHVEIYPTIDWVICGGESGPGARPMNPDWARSVRDQCKAAGVPFFFKQWGKHVYPSQMTEAEHLAWDVQYGTENVKERSIPVGKKRAGSLLDGVEHKEYPK